MAITYIGKGNQSSVTTGSPTPAYPSGWQQDDIMIWVNHGNNGNTPTGFTFIAFANGSGQDDTHVYWRRAQTGDDTTPAIGGGGNNSAQIYGFRGCLTSGDPYEGLTSGVDGTSDTSYGPTGTVTTTGSDRMCVFVCGRSGDFGGGRFSGETDASGLLVNLTEQADNGYTNGLGGGWALYTGEAPSADTYGGISATLLSANNKAWVEFALIPDLGEQAVDPPLLGGAQAFAPSIAYDQTVTPGALGPSQAFTPQINLATAVGLLGGSQVFTPTIEPGAVSVVVGLLGGASLFTPDVVASGASQSIDATLLGGAQIFAPDFFIYVVSTTLGGSQIFTPDITGIPDPVAPDLLGGVQVFSPQLNRTLPPFPKLGGAFSWRPSISQRTIAPTLLGTAKIKKPAVLGTLTTTQAAEYEPYAGTVTIRYNGINITPAVLWKPTVFTSSAGSKPGECQIWIKDIGHLFTFVTGKTITLDIDGVRQWGGFVSGVKRRYFFDGTTGSASSIPRALVLEGSDYNILLHKRVLYDKVDPTVVKLTTYPANTNDDEIIRYYMEHHLDLDEDDISTALVEHVGTPSLDDEISGAASWTWDQFMHYLNWNVGAIYYIDPDKRFVYTDVDTPTAPFAISDAPAVYAGLLSGESSFFDAFNREGPGIGDTTNYSAIDEVEAGTTGSALQVVVNGYAEWNITASTAFGSFQIDFYTDTNDTARFVEIDTPPGVASDSNTYWTFGYALSNGDGTWEFGLGRGDAANVYTNFALEPNTWYTMKGLIDPDAGFLGLKHWRTSDPEPTAWNMSSTPSPWTGGATSSYLGVGGGLNTVMTVDNLRLTDIANMVGDIRGVRELEIDFDGTQLRNDALAWGAGQGQDQIVFARVQDSASQADHGRWQEGQFIGNIWVQSTIDRVADSQVYGSPQNRRGGKDDRVVVRAVTFEPGLRVADKIIIASAVHDAILTLPIRRIDISFATPFAPQYRLTASHEIDDPWSSFDPLPPFSLDFDPHLIWDPPGPPIDPCADYAASCVDTFTRTVSESMGTGEIGTWYTNTSAFSVDGDSAVISTPYSQVGWPVQVAALHAQSQTLPVEVLIDTKTSENYDPTSYTYYSGYERFSISDGTNPTTFTSSAVLSFDSKAGTATLSVAGPDGTSDSLEIWPTRASWVGFDLKLRILFESTQTRAKLWRAVDSEPGSWQVSITHSAVTYEYWKWAVNGYPGSYYGGPDYSYTYEISNLEFVQGFCGSFGCLDTFDRTESGSWGVGDMGTWQQTDFNSNAVISVDGDNGIIDVQAVGDNVTEWVDVAPTGMALPIEILWRFKIRWSDEDNWDIQFQTDSEPDPASSLDWVYITLSPDIHGSLGSPHYWTLGFNLESSVGGGDFLADIGWTSATVNSGQYVEGEFYVRSRIESSLVAAKIWQVGDSEPGSWTLQDTGTSQIGLDGQLVSVGISTTLASDGVVGCTYTMYSLEVVEGCSDPCADPLTAPPPDPPVLGTEVCENLSRILTPSWESSSGWLYYKMSSAYALLTTRVWFDGVLLQRGTDYEERSNGGYIRIDSSLFTGDIDATHIYACYTSRQQTVTAG